MCWEVGVLDGVVLSDSHNEGGSAYPQGVINKLDERTLILPQQQHLAEDVIRPAPEELFKGLILRVTMPAVEL